MSNEFSLEELASKLNGRLIQSTELTLTGVASLDMATPSDVAFVLDSAQLPLVSSSKAGVFVVNDDIEDDVPYIVVNHTRRALITVLNLFHPEPQPTYEISAKADISSSAKLSGTVAIGAFSSIGAESVIGEQSVIHPNVTIGAHCEIGEGCVLYPGVVLYDHTVLGSNVSVQAGSVIGSTGFGYVESKEGWQAIPHIGRVVLENGVHIGANVCIDRGCLSDTVIGEGSIIDNLNHIGHNVTFGKQCAVAATSVFAGSCTLGERVKVSAHVGVDSHVSIGDDSMVFVKSGVTKSWPSDSKLLGFPARDSKEYHERDAFLNRLYKKKRSFLD